MWAQIILVVTAIPVVSLAAVTRTNALASAIQTVKLATDQERTSVLPVTKEAI